MQSLVEAPLYGGFIAGEFRKGVCLVCIPNKGLPERGGFGVSYALKLSGFVRGLLVLLFVGYDRCGKVYVRLVIDRTLGPGVGASLLSSSLGQFRVKFEGENAGLDPSEAP